MGPFFQVILAESWGFEPQMPFWGILAYQASTFGLSVSSP